MAPTMSHDKYNNPIWFSSKYLSMLSSSKWFYSARARQAGADVEKKGLIWQNSTDISLQLSYRALQPARWPFTHET